MTIRICAIIFSMSTTQEAANPPKTQVLNFSNPYLTGFIIGLILFIPALLIARTHEFTGFQLQLFRAINNLPDGLTQPALLVTEALGAAYPIAICVVVAMLFKRFRLAWRYAVIGAGTVVVMEAAKLIAKEPRPFVTLAGNLHLRASELGLTSFPSGHMAVATALALVTWMILPRAWSWLSVLWIVLVAFSRLYLGVHTPNDLVGGFAIGLMAVSFIQILPEKISKPLHLDNHEPLLDRGF